MASSRYPRSRVRGYTRADGTYVRGHLRARPGTGTSSSYSSSARSSSTAAAGGGIGIFVFLLVLGVLYELSQRAG